jgi:hypothetical protein
LFAAETGSPNSRLWMLLGKVPSSERLSFSLDHRLMRFMSCLRLSACNHVAHRLPSEGARLENGNKCVWQESILDFVTGL